MKLIFLCLVLFSFVSSSNPLFEPIFSNPQRCNRAAFSGAFTTLIANQSRPSDDLLAAHAYFCDGKRIAQLNKDLRNGELAKWRNVTAKWRNVAANWCSTC
ncbi:unnamed protein product, partial [Mesorhabditis belari]|uniref:Uncharacterized protein n=1 Tax=Mesorhabditis belari TaxID=2138241 RepID=A0AAF3EC33_9BILA